MGRKAKRTWHYLMKPQEFEIVCPICKGSNLNWSEYAKHIWCYDCKKDIKDFENHYDGPIPMGVASMLGLNFDIYNMKTKKIERYNIEQGKWISE